MADGARRASEQLLTPEELEAARATTLNAHYTSPTVVRAMYRALERFGFERRAHSGTGVRHRPFHRPHAGSDAPAFDHHRHRD